MPRPLHRPAKEGGEEVNLADVSGTDQPASQTSDTQPGIGQAKCWWLVWGIPVIEYQFTPHNAGFLAIDRIATLGDVQIANRHCRALTATRKDRKSTMSCWLSRRHL